MASRRKQQLDPNAVHYPHSGGFGAVCDVRPRPTDASHYSVDLEDLTCEWCHEYLERVQAHGAMTQQALRAGDVGQDPRPALTSGPTSKRGSAQKGV